jgi:hypothetical protein
VNDPDRRASTLRLALWTIPLQFRAAPLPTGEIGAHSGAPADCRPDRASTFHGDEEGEPKWLPFIFLARNDLLDRARGYRCRRGIEPCTTHTAYGCRGATGMCRSSTPRHWRSESPSAHSSGSSGTVCRQRSSTCRFRDSARARCSLVDTTSSGDVASEDLTPVPAAEPAGTEHRCPRRRSHSGRSHPSGTLRRCWPAGCPECTVRRWAAGPLRCRGRRSSRLDRWELSPCRCLERTRSPACRVRADVLARAAEPHGHRDLLPSSPVTRPIPSWGVGRSDRGSLPGRTCRTLPHF